MTSASKQSESLVSTLLFWGSVGFVLAYSGVLLGAFSVQLFAHEFPCPLCMLQRYAMILTVIPQLWIVTNSLRGKLKKVEYARCLGMSIIAAVAGSFESTRQILLHIATKGDPGYGSAVLGLHLYTWALITFIVVILYCGGALMAMPYGTPVAPRSPAWRGMARAAMWLFLGLVVANLVAIILLEGFAWILPDDPTKYHLLQQLGFH